MFHVHALTEEQVHAANIRYQERETSARSLAAALDTLYTLTPGPERDLTLANMRTIFELWRGSVFPPFESSETSDTPE